jgi:hypothetical protein
MFDNRGEVDRILRALSEQIAALTPERFDLVVCGGSALNALGLVRRTTRDVDVLAFLEVDRKGGLRPHAAKPFPKVLIDAAAKVARDFRLPADWLNPGPTSALELGLPKGLLRRLETHDYGDALTIRFLSRYDQIHFKLYAAVDQGGKHLEDLVALKPTATELEAAARWSMTHDVSEPYKEQLKKMLMDMGHSDVADRL